MKENEMKTQADPVLDAELAQMAEEVPPMPADFHEKWMNAVRAEVQKSAPAAENTDKTGTKTPVSLTRWTRILSVAAVFVFLIGGTILYRNSRKTLTNAAFRTEAKNAVMLSAEVPAAGAVPEGQEETEASGKDAIEGAVMMAAESAVEETVFEEAAVPDEAALYEEDAEYAAADAAAEYAAAEEAVMPEAAEAELGAYEAVPMAAMKAAETPVPTGMPTEAPAEQVVESMTEAEEAPEAETVPEAEKAPDQEAEPEKAGFMQQAGAFLTDMGDFLLAALPYLAVLAVPAAAALVIRRKKK